MKQSAELAITLMSWAEHEHSARLLIDARGRPLWCNRAARTALGDPVDLRAIGIDANALAPLRPLDEIVRAQAHPAEPSLMLLRVRRLPDQTGEPVFGVSIRTGGADRTRAFAALAETFGLTGAEVRVIETLLSGLAAADAAKALGVKVTTVRAHVRSAYAKLGCANRESLFQLVEPLLG